MKRITLPLSVAAIGFICFFILIASTKHCNDCFSPSTMALKLIVCGLVIVAGILSFRRAYLENEKIIFNIESLPLLETDEAVEGVPFVGQGTIDSEDGKLLTSPFTRTPCVYYHSILEKYVQEGKSHTWRVVENNARFVPFHLKDDRGAIDIDLTNMDDDFSSYGVTLHENGVPDPKQSEIDAIPVAVQIEYSENNSPKLFGFSVRNSDKFRKSEYVLKPGMNVFVCGSVAKNEDGELVLRESRDFPLIISKKDRDQYVNEFYRGDSLVYVTYILTMAGYTIFLYATNYFLNLSGLFLSALAVGGNLLIILGALFSLYNRIITLKYRALAAQSDIEVELQRRADLIPNLVEVVRGYSVQEAEVHLIVSGARAGIVRSGTMGGSKSFAIPGLLAVAEKYPELKASQNFQKLMRALADSESRIAYSREFYNRTVRKYNTLIGQLPYLLVSRPLNMKTMDFIAVGAFEKNAPEAVF
ncbi:MAG: LemA family protein [Candidatus Nealsonbacteria bacterium]|nr:LemA family protein [Candidatus Nealsonbacteria bacterium]